MIFGLWVASGAIGCDAPTPPPAEPPPEQEVAEAAANRTAEEEQKAMLEAIGYLGSTDVKSEVTGVTAFDRDRAYPGLNFFTSGHAPTAYLMDMDGETIHEWSTSLNEIWPKKKPHPLYKPFFRKAYLYENGDMLGIWEGRGLVKLDKDSNVLWANPDLIHHDLEVLENGDIWVLSRKARMIPRLDEEAPILEDFVVLLDSEGKEQARLSLLEAFEKSAKYHDYLVRRPNRAGDIFHTNTLAVLKGGIAERHPAFAQGNMLVSMSSMHVLAVVDPRAHEVVWVFEKKGLPFHDPKLLDNGNMLVLSNLKLAQETLKVDLRSEVFEYDLDDMSVVWRYAGTEDRPFLTTCCGTAQRLKNGNTLIAETTGGRALEVDPDGVIVWEYLNPHGDVEAAGRLFAIPEMIRLPEDFPTGWANRESS
jgi:hypothetical protein